MPLAEDYTFKLGTSGVILNTDATPPFVDITRVIGFDSAEARETQREWEGNDGTWMDAEYEKGRGIILEGSLYADVDVVEQFLDDLKANWAVSRDLVLLYFKAAGVDERALLVKPLGLKYDWESARRWGEARIQFKCFAEDPRIYAGIESLYYVDLNSVAVGGFGFPFSFPFGFGTASAGLGTNLPNVGNRSTPFEVIIHGPTVNPVIVNDDTGEQMDFNITLNSGSYLIVNTKYRTVRLDGVANRRNALINPSWFHLQPGDNHIRYLADVAGALPLQFTYRSAWR
jgi:hypothetical protein